MWRALIATFDAIDEWIIWKVGNGRRLKIGQEPWIGCYVAHKISLHMISSLRDQGLLHLIQVGDVSNTSP